MGMVVRSNIMALNANRQLGMNNSSVAKNLEKLSSGFRINRAGDDASGLAISEKMKAQIKGLETASMNSQDGISLIQTAEGNLTEVHSMLNRMVELAEKSANGTMEIGTDGVGGTDRNALQAEMDALAKEIDRIADSANFNNIKLLDGSLKSSAQQNVNTEVTVDANSIGTADFEGMTIGEDGTYTLMLNGASANVTVNLKKGDNGEDIADKLAKAINANTPGTASVDGSKLSTGSFTAEGFYSLSANETVAVKAGDKFVYDFSAVDFAAMSASNAANHHLKFGSGGAIDIALGVAANSPDVEIGDDMNETLKNIAQYMGSAGFTTTFGNNVNYDFSVKGNKLIMTAKQDIDAGAGTRLGGMSLTDGTTATTQYAMDTGSKQQDGLILQIGDTSEIFNQMEVSVSDMHMSAMFKGSVIKDEDTGNAKLTTLDNGSISLDITSQEGAGSVMTAVKKVINTVSTQRANLGALQNRLEYTINNLDVAAENMNAANSRIRDTDMAKQMMDYTKMNVLTQAAQAMLAQANQQPQSILQLLQ